MYHFISGVLDDVGEDYLVVDTNGIGYRIYTSLKSIHKLDIIGEKIKVFTHLHVKEDALTLYGFTSKEELKCFLQLISVSGIGPKVGLGILSHLESYQLALAIIGDDIKTLTSCPGVGNKTAQRIILELRDKIKAENAVVQQSSIQNINNIDDSTEAVNALVVLGYNYKDAARVVSNVIKDSQHNSLQDIIKAALKQLISK